MRLAFVSPLPPAATGIADYAADLLPALAERHAVELFHAQEAVDRARLPRLCPIFPAAELIGRHRARGYDLVVHQLGNGSEHAFVYPLLPRVPGLLVLHELVLFHSRAAAFLDGDAVRAWRRDPASVAAREAARPALEAWRAELVYSYPAQGARLYEAHLGTVGDWLPYAYPLFRVPVETARAVAVHSAFAAEAVRAEVPQAEVVRVPMLARAEPVERAAVRRLRERLGFGEHHLVVGSYGLLTREKRIETVVEAVARAARREPRLRLLLAGPVRDRSALESALDRHSLRSRTAVTGRIDDAELVLHIEAADIVAHLRFPTGRETSAALLRVLAQGRPTIVSDLAHQADLPSAAVRRVSLTDEPEALLEAILGLAADPDERRRLGEAAAEHVRRAHGPEQVVEAWARTLDLASRLPDPPTRDWPAHWRRA